MRTKRILAIMCCALFIPSFFAIKIYAKQQPILEVSTVEALKGDYIDITISIRNNPGVVTMGVNVLYDKGALTLTRVKDGGLLGNALHTSNLGLVPYYLKWENSTAQKNFTSDGIIATLTFKVLDNASYGKHMISLSYEQNNAEIINVDLEDVNFELHNGCVIISKDANINNIEVDENTKAYIQKVFAFFLKVLNMLKTAFGRTTIS